MAKKLVPKFTSDEAARQANQIIRDNIVKGSRSASEALLSGTASRDEVIAKVAGILDLSASQTKTYVDTALAIIGRARTLAVAKDAGFVWYRYIGGIIETSRDFCIERNGKYYSIDEIESWPPESYSDAWDGMIKGTDQDNILYYCGGWNCRHQFIPVLASMVPEIRDTQTQTEPEVIPAPEMIPAIPKYEQALQTMEEKIRKQKFESGYVVDEFGNEVLFKNGQKASVTFTGEESRKLTGNYFTHNHPSTNNGLSPADLATLINTKAREMRAITKDGSLYIAKLTQNSPSPGGSDIYKLLDKHYKNNQARLRAEVTPFIRSKNYGQDEFSTLYVYEYNKLAAQQFDLELITRLRPEDAKIITEYYNYKTLK